VGLLEKSEKKCNYFLVATITGKDILTVSKQQKLRSRLGTIPKDFTWDELVTLLKSYGFVVLNGSGSRRKFVNAEKRLINIHCPHPGSIVKQYSLKDVKSVLDELDNL